MSDQFFKKIIIETAKVVDKEIKTEELNIEKATQDYKQATAALLRMFAKNKCTSFNKNDIHEMSFRKEIDIPDTAQCNLELILETLAEKGYVACFKGPHGTPRHLYRYNYRFDMI